MRVLIADDSDILVERLVAALRKVSGVEVVGRAWTGAGAVETMWRLKPDVVILDLCMPGGSGIEVLEGLKTDQLNPLVIVLSNYGQSQYRKKCLATGASFFFDKSTEFEKVGEVLRRLVQTITNGPLPNEPAQIETKGPESASRTQLDAGAPSKQEGLSMTEIPRLVVSNSSKGEPIYYMCSSCLQGFSPAENESPRQAVTQLYRWFREHVEQKHPEPAEGCGTAAAA